MPMSCVPRHRIEPVRDQNTRNTSLFADELAQESLGGAGHDGFAPARQARSRPDRRRAKASVLAADGDDDLVEMHLSPN